MDWGARGAWRRRRRIIEGGSQEEKCGKAKHCSYFYGIIFGSPMGLEASPTLLDTAQQAAQ